MRWITLKRFYDAGHRRACQWWTVDLCCFGGLTPKLVDELENTGFANGNAVAKPDCTKHAGYSADLSCSLSAADKDCTNGDTIKWRDQVLGELDKSIAETKNGTQQYDVKRLDAALRKSLQGNNGEYADSGYAPNSCNGKHTQKGY